MAWLDGPEASAAGHGELEARLQVHSREQYRLLLQGHLDERARLELRGVTGSDGVLLPRVENGHRRGLTTVFWSVTVTRKAYRAVPGITAADTGTACPSASDALPGSEAEPLPFRSSAIAPGSRLYLTPVRPYLSDLQGNGRAM
jgi:hypothetical protein